MATARRPKARNSLHELSRPLARRLEREIAERTGLVVLAESPAYEFHHTVTRFRIRLLCVTAENRGGTLNLPANFRWATPSQFRRLALSMPARKFADRLTAPVDSPAAPVGAPAGTRSARGR